MKETDGKVGKGNEIGLLRESDGEGAHPILGWGKRKRKGMEQPAFSEMEWVNWC